MENTANDIMGDKINSFRNEFKIEALKLVDTLKAKHNLPNTLLLGVDEIGFHFDVSDFDLR